MPSTLSEAPADVAASDLLSGPAAPLADYSTPIAASPPAAALAAPKTDVLGLSRPRLAKFLSYYRPHLWLLAADLGCAILISATTLALPVCANFVVKRLAGSHASPALMVEIGWMGAAMLALLAMQALSTLFVDYQGHVMGAKMESEMRR